MVFLKKDFNKSLQMNYLCKKNFSSLEKKNEKMEN